MVITTATTSYYIFTFKDGREPSTSSEIVSSTFIPETTSMVSKGNQTTKLITTTGVAYTLNEFAGVELYGILR